MKKERYAFNKIFAIFIIVLLVCGQTSFFSNTTTLKGEESTRVTSEDAFDESIIELMDKAHFPSLAIAIIKNESITWSKGYGYADIKDNEKPTIDTVYMLASISKTFTTTAIMQLWERGFFDLDDDINDYLPFSVRNPQYPTVPITFRMLLSHRSSISGNNIRLFTYFSLLNYPYSYLKEYLTPGGILYSERNWKNERPGQTQVYSSTGIELLGYLIECITNQSFTSYCKDNILNPLEMNDSSHHVSDFEKESLAVQYIYLFGKYIPLPFFEDKNYASGGLRSTVNDLSHYLIAFMNGGVYKNTRILDEETIDLMFTLQYNDSRFPGFGLGWQIFWSRDENNRSTRIGHNGGMPGSLTYMFYHVHHDAGVIILSNQHLFYRFEEMMSCFTIINLVSQKIETV
jgi:CubicO group peptidase (beta-lactamase class C family)